MIDNTKVYVLTSNGHIYYYSVSDDSFIDSGLIYASNLLNYFSFISNLDNTNDCDNLTDNGWYFAGGSSPNNWPKNGLSGILQDYYSNAYRHYQIVYLYESNNPVYIRHQTGTSWGSWTLINPINPLYNTKNNNIRKERDKAILVSF